MKIFKNKLNISPDITLDPNQINIAKFAIKAIAHPIRSQIMHTLKVNGEMSVTDIQREIRIDDHSTVCGHLKTLRDNNFVFYRQDGKKHFYRFNLNGVKNINRLIRSAGGSTELRSEKAFEVCRALTNDFRMEIISFVFKNGDTIAGDIYKGINRTQSSTSQQNGILQNAGVVVSVRKGKYIRKRVNVVFLEKVIQAVKDYHYATFQDKKNRTQNTIYCH